MTKSPKWYTTGLVLAMVMGMVLAACFGAGPEPTAAEPVAEDAAAPAAEPAAEEAAAPEAQGESTLSTVMDRGILKCGTGAGASPGFAFIQEDGSWDGFNVDFCKAFAAAVLGDASAIEPVVTTGTTRFPILQSGEADVLSNNTTWTL